MVTKNAFLVRFLIKKLTSLANMRQSFGRRVNSPSKMPRENTGSLLQIK